MRGYEQRRTVRVPLLISLRVETSVGTFRGQGRDISLGGIGVYLKRFPPVGSMVDLELALPRSTQKIRVSGEVVYVKRGSPAETWMGVKFTRMDAASQEEIRRYVRETHGSDNIEGPAPPPLPQKR